MTEEHTTTDKTPKNGRYGGLIAFGVTLLVLTFIASIVVWHEEVTATLNNIPEVYFAAVLLSMASLAVVATVYGHFKENKGVYEAGLMGLTLLGFSLGLSLVMPASEFLSDIITRTVPDTVTPIMWAVASLVFASVMIVVGICGMYIRGDSSE